MSEMAFLSLIDLAYIFLGSIQNFHLIPVITVRNRAESNKNTFDKHLIVLGSAELGRPATKKITKETNSKGNPWWSDPSYHTPKLQKFIFSIKNHH